MNFKKRKTLVVIGAGPKGIAVAVKAKVLEELGLPVDRVILVERHSVGAHWSGEAGYTDGEMVLGTSPEKDVVYPLESETGDPELDTKIRQRLMTYTWSAYLIESHLFSDWVDRGKPAPKHSEWATYLKWVSRRLAPEVSILYAQVKSIDLNSEEEKWSLDLVTKEGNSSLLADRLMLTGPGKTKLNIERSILPFRAYDLESFWKALKSGTFQNKEKIAIIGAGENAASILVALSKQSAVSEIEVISPRGFISTRAENYYENQFYSQPDRRGWNALEIADRKDFIRRTDIGVFSVEAMKILNGEKNHKIVPGRLIDLHAHDEGFLVTLVYAGQVFRTYYDKVIFATGFDLSASLRKIFSSKAVKHIEEKIGAPLSNDELSGRILKDLSVKDLIPSLHLPMLAGLMQGPGFANLSCLGLLSDRVILGPLFESMPLDLDVMEA